MTDNELLGLLDRSGDGCSEDEIFGHFEKFESNDWTEIAEEARRVWSLVLGDEIEKDSIADGILAASIVRGFNGALSCVALALDINFGSLKLVIENIAESGLEAPMGIDGFIEEIRKSDKWIAEHALDPYQ